MEPLFTEEELKELLQVSAKWAKTWREVERLNKTQPLDQRSNPVYWAQAE